MRVGGNHLQSITLGEDHVVVIDQTHLPEALTLKTLRTVDDVAFAISNMVVRGAPLIGVTAAAGVWLAALASPSDAALDEAITMLTRTRPTAKNLVWALDRMHAELARVAPAFRADAARASAARILAEDVAACQAIAHHGAMRLRARWEALDRPEPLQILTHCNAGWLATVDHGTALAPLYQLHDEGVPLHVWVDETRPRNQGLLTAWELGQHGVPHTLIVDNAGGLLMQRGQVHAVIVGADRIAMNGDVCNKIGTYLKALAAHDTNVELLVAAPTSTFDPDAPDGASIPIEERAASEVTSDPTLSVANPAFDVTPARLVTALVTERGVVAADRGAIAPLLAPVARGAGGRTSEAT